MNKKSIFIVAISLLFIAAFILIPTSNSPFATAAYPAPDVTQTANVEPLMCVVKNGVQVCPTPQPPRIENPYPQPQEDLIIQTDDSFYSRILRLLRK